MIIVECCPFGRDIDVLLRREYDNRTDLWLRGKRDCNR
jgi:hypothetical protein